MGFVSSVSYEGSVGFVRGVVSVIYWDSVCHVGFVGGMGSVGSPGSGGSVGFRVLWVLWVL